VLPDERTVGDDLAEVPTPIIQTAYGSYSE
jgi:hypothetical protein